ncbi:TetR/AcrR family transcriptional regulator [Mycobacterium sp. BMJ-28]
MPFLRARSADQRRDRAAHLLETTRALLTESAAVTLTLRQIGDAAGLAKSGVLRYAGSLEALLLQVMYDEHLAWVDSVREAFEQNARRPGRVLARTLAARPVLCDLISSSPVLLGRLSPDEQNAVRAQGLDIQKRLGAVLGPHLTLSDNQLALLAAAIHAFVGTGFAWSTPPSASSDPFVNDFEATLGQLLEVFLTGLGSA